MKYEFEVDNVDLVAKIKCNCNSVVFHVNTKLDNKSLIVISFIKTIFGHFYHLIDL